jgi:hypothetical protein
MSTIVQEIEGAGIRWLELGTGKNCSATAVFVFFFSILIFRAQLGDKPNGDSLALVSSFSVWWLTSDYGDLTFQRPAFACVNACRKTILEMNFMYLGNKDSNCIFKICCIISEYLFYFPQVLFILQFYCFLFK